MSVEALKVVSRVVLGAEWPPLWAGGEECGSVGVPECCSYRLLKLEPIIEEDAIRQEA